MTIIIHVDAPGDVIGIKEAIASRLEDLGGVRVVEVRPDVIRQVRPDRKKDDDDKPLDGQEVLW